MDGPRDPGGVASALEAGPRRRLLGTIKEAALDVPVAVMTLREPGLARGTTRSSARARCRRRRASSFRTCRRRGRRLDRRLLPSLGRARLLAAPGTRTTGCGDRRGVERVRLLRGDLRGHGRTGPARRDRPGARGRLGRSRPPAPGGRGDRARPRRPPRRADVRGRRGRGERARCDRCSIGRRRRRPRARRPSARSRSSRSSPGPGRRQSRRRAARFRISDVGTSKGWPTAPTGGGPPGPDVRCGTATSIRGAYRPTDWEREGGYDEKRRILRAARALRRTHARSGLACSNDDGG